MKISIAAGLLGMASAAVVPISSQASTTTSTQASTLAVVQTDTPVAAADTNVTIVDLGIEPAVLKIPVKANPNFTPNVTNAILAAQAKYVILEETIQKEKRDLLALEEDFQTLEKRRAGFPAVAAAVPATSTSAAQRAAFAAITTAKTSSTTSAPTKTPSPVSLPCAYFPAFCVTSKSTSTSVKTTSTSAKSTSTSAKTTSTSAKTTSTSAKTTSTSAKTTSTSAKTTSTSAKTTSTTSLKTTSTTSTSLKTTSTSSTSFKPTSTTTSTSGKPTFPTISTTTSSKPTSTSTAKTSTITTSIKATTTSSKSSTTSSRAAATSLLSLAAENIQLDSEFLSEIAIGSNGNTLDVVMDTGSADLWMFSTDCVGCSSNHEFYNPSQSTTFVNTTTKFSLTYGDGSKTSGLLGFDTVNLAGAPIQAQSIDVAHTISASLQSNAMDGILGLGFPNLMSVQGVPGVTTPIANMVSQGLIPTGKFGLQYIKTNHWSYSGGGGAWTFGGYDKSVVSGAINTVALTRAQYWMISMSQVSVGSAYSYTPSQNVIVDSGTTLILLDSASVANIHAYLPGGRVSPDNTHYQIFCNASDAAYTGTRNAYFTIGGQKYGVPAADLAWYPESNTPGYCYSGIQPWSNSFGILGVMFLKNVYAVFDQTNAAFGLGVRSDLAALTD